jgi:hypothetical protein
MQKYAKRMRTAADASYTIALNKLHDRDSGRFYLSIALRLSRGARDTRRETQGTDHECGLWPKMIATE